MTSIFFQKLAKMTSQWRHINFLGTFLRFLTDFTTCVKISAHLKHFYGNWFLTSIYVILTIFWAKWRHNDVTRKKKSIFFGWISVLQLFGNFQPQGIIFTETEGGAFLTPPPGLNRGMKYPGLNRVNGAFLGIRGAFWALWG